MTLQHKLQTPEGTFIEEVQGNYLHFAIDCICGGKSGSYYKNASESTQEIFDGHWPRNPETRLKHTFYMNDDIVRTLLGNWHNPESTPTDVPLIIVCKDCRREFSFTNNSYEALSQEIVSHGETVETRE